MEEHETLEKVKGKQGILSKIQNFLTLGYGTKEDLRELDKKLRNLYYEDLRDMRHVWEEVYLKILDSNVKSSNRDAKRVLQRLDVVMERIHRADYGYAGLYDRKGHIREDELAKVLNYDRELDVHVGNLKVAVEKAHSDAEDENLTDLPTDVKEVKGLLSTLDDKWNERKRLFRPLEV